MPAYLDGWDGILDVVVGDYHRGEGHDAYVFGQGFGTDVIDDVEPAFSTHKPDLIRFADIASTEVTATREGLDQTIRDPLLAA